MPEPTKEWGAGFEAGYARAEQGHDNLRERLSAEEAAANSLFADGTALAQRAEAAESLNTRYRTALQQAQDHLYESLPNAARRVIGEALAPDAGQGDT